MGISEWEWKSIKSTMFKDGFVPLTGTHLSELKSCQKLTTGRILLLCSHCVLFLQGQDQLDISATSIKNIYWLNIVMTFVKVAHEECS